MQMRRKALLSLIVGLTAISSAACAGGSKRPDPERYTVGIIYPEDGGGVFNKTGDEKDDFWLTFAQMHLFRCLPEEDWIKLNIELATLRAGRPGSLSFREMP